MEQQRAGRRKRPKKAVGSGEAAVAIRFKPAAVRIALSTLQDFIGACVTPSQRRSKLTTQLSTSGVAAVKVVVTTADLDEEEAAAEADHVAALKESPSAAEIAYLLYYKRVSTQAGMLPGSLPGSLSGPVPEWSYTAAEIEPYVLDDPEPIYGERSDLRLHHILYREKKQLLLDHSRLSDGEIERLNQHPGFSLGQPVTVADQASDPVPASGCGEREPSRYHPVLVNQTPMVRFTQPTQHDLIGLDCEMVSTTKGMEVGRVGIVDGRYQPLYDQVVRPEGTVLDYLTEFSGLTANSFSSSGKSVVSYQQLIAELSGIIGSQTVIVGHSLAHDMKALRIYHPRCIDTSLLFSKDDYFKMKLKDIAKKYLQLTIQSEHHSPIVDAITAIKAWRLKLAIDRASPETASPLAAVVPAWPGVPFQVSYLLGTVRRELPAPGIQLQYTDTFEPPLPHGGSVLIAVYPNAAGWKVRFFTNKY